MARNQGRHWSSCRGQPCTLSCISAPHSIFANVFDQNSLLRGKCEALLRQVRAKQRKMVHTVVLENAVVYVAWQAGGRSREKPEWAQRMADNNELLSNKHIHMPRGVLGSAPLSTYFQLEHLDAKHNGPRDFGDILFGRGGASRARFRLLGSIAGQQRYFLTVK